MKVLQYLLILVPLVSSQKIDFSDEDQLSRKMRDLIGWNRYSNTLRRLADARAKGQSMKSIEPMYLRQIQNFLLRQRI